MEDKKQEIKKEDLKLIAIELMDLKFNRLGNCLLCEYIREKLEKDGVKVNLDSIEEKGEFNDFVIDYSMKSKREGIKDMSREIITIGEEKGLNKDTPLGVWLNLGVECMSMKIIDDVLKDVEKIVDRRVGGIWELYSRQTDKELMNISAVSIFDASKMWDRMANNIKQIKFNCFRKLNKFIW